MPSIHIYPNARAVACAAAHHIVESQLPGQPFRLALSGGSTPRLLYQLLVQPPYVNAIDWPQIELFWGDERPVPPEHPDSNYRMAYEALIQHVPIPPAHIHRIQAELPPEQAADAYDQHLHKNFPNIPAFDVMLLGMGTDGHTASLFPHTAALHENSRWCVANHIPTLKTSRITLTYPAINAAKKILVLVTGAAKAPMLSRVLYGAYSPEELPIQAVKPNHGELLWLIDEAAASALPPNKKHRHHDGV